MDEVINSSSRFPKGHTPWNKGLTKYTDERIALLHKKREAGFHEYVSRKYRALGLGKRRLSYLYFDMNMSPRGIAKELGVSRDVITYALRHWDIKIKSRKEGAKAHSSEKRREVMLSVLRQTTLSPNKEEIKLMGILNDVCPGEYKYTGSGEVIIGGMIPDYFNANGQKKVIELFGTYWHTVKGATPNRTEAGRIKEYKKYGFDCLVIWDKELKDLTSVKERIMVFNTK